MLSSSIDNPIPPFGSNVTLICAMELMSPTVDIPVTVITALTSSEGLATTSTAQPVVGSLTSYVATYMISSFRRSDSGLYSCGASVRSTSNAYVSDSNTVSHSVRLTTGEIFTVFSAILIITAVC